MSNEKYNSNWKTGLQELTVLPGEDKPDMNAAWGKLEVRLNTKKKNRKLLFYWLAAASVLTCILIAIMPGKPGKEIVNPQFTQQNNSVDKRGIVKPFSQEKFNDVAIAPSNKKEKHEPVPNKIAVVKSNAIPTIPEPLVTNITENKDSLITTTIIPQTIKSKPIVFASLKKKMPVVHINELEKPVGQIESVAGNNDRPVFRVRLFNRSISTGSSTYTNDNNIGLKIKLPTQN